MGTLNSGFVHSSRSKVVTDNDRQMINDFIHRHGARACPPANLQGNESSRSTHERVMQMRKEYRDLQRSK